MQKARQVMQSNHAGSRRSSGSKRMQRQQWRSSEQCSQGCRVIQKSVWMMVTFLSGWLLAGWPSGILTGTDVWHGEWFGMGCVYIQVYYLAMNILPVSINSQFPMQPILPYHLLRLKNHLFILTGNFTSQGLDQISNLLDLGEMMVASCPLFFQCILPTYSSTVFYNVETAHRACFGVGSTMVLFLLLEIVSGNLPSSPDASLDFKASWL